jgi:hypothetical protein
MMIPIEIRIFVMIFLMIVFKIVDLGFQLRVNQIQTAHAGVRDTKAASGQAIAIAHHAFD